MSIEPATRAGAPSATPSTTTPRLLLADDEESVLLSIQAVLELDGYQVVSTLSGYEAVARVRAEAFDVVLTDLRLDDFDGLEVLRALRETAPDSAGIVLTGYASMDSALDALREGAYDYLVKPCEVEELRAAVRRGLERCRLARDLRERVRDLELANTTVRALNLELEQRVEEATAALREQVQQRDEFLATVSHDLRSPLAFIKGLASLRRRRAEVSPETEPLLDALAQIESSAAKMAGQIDDLMDVSRLQAGRDLDLRRETVDLVALARRAAAEHQQTTERHTLRVRTAAEAVIGQWDPARLARVLDNLLGNAIKYSPRGGPVEVDVLIEPDAAVVLRVRDAGEGIPSADLPHVFERFRRGANVAGRIPGSGLGLAGVRQIVQQHGGTIEAESQVGRGTTVTVRLPR